VVNTSRTRPLRQLVSRVVPRRPFALRFWDGTVVPATEQPAVEFAVNDPVAIAHLFRSPNELGLGRAYTTGLLDIDDFDLAIRIVDTWKPPPVGWSDRARLFSAALLAWGFRGFPRRPDLELNLPGRRHSIERDAAAVRYHYDVGNEFFALFLDESMTYSCAIFSRGAQNLEQAQETKLDLVATKLELEPGQRVLDVGCGWGSFAIHAASRYGVSVVGITLSPAQAELARQRVADAGLGDRIEIRVADYRRIADEPFDAIASIGMVEHVGESQIDEYAQALRRLIKAEGTLLNHGITVLRPGDDPADDLFSNRYVFPDGEALPLSRVQLALERAGFQALHIEGFAGDYAETLRHWAARLDEHLPEAEQLAGPERLRIWRLYLRGARYAFEGGFNSVYQVRARPY
jgi:cyclopropane-fatty-acyl-phospholipid synthase